METRNDRMPTTGEIAHRLGVKLHVVEYVVRSRNVRPAGWAGGVRVFSEADVNYIRSEIGRMRAGREDAAHA